ncbi:hypothetical protein DRE_00743 [Drechslerella stenobrocha 248]|uniref:Uncharacterized protein n=1 Tax=Drechslerella stenobrocha 248 TaxID=1043628 RepID=W7HQA9_9PEZI|nr:hypothetical protein DRE_00743 [Drechslerella stenobrocha 248]
MTRVRPEPAKTSSSKSQAKKAKARRKLLAAAAPTSQPGEPSNLVLDGFKKNMKFKTIYKAFQRRGVTDRGQIARQMQEQWGSCPKYTDALRSYWENLQVEQTEHFAMLRREDRKNRKLQADKQASEAIPIEQDIPAHPSTWPEAEPGVEGMQMKPKTTLFRFRRNEAKIPDFDTWKDDQQDGGVLRTKAWDGGNNSVRVAPTVSSVEATRSNVMPDYEDHLRVNLGTLLENAKVRKPKK